MAEYSQAAELAPLIPEIPFWKAVTLADMGRVDEALPIFKQVFQSSPRLKLLVQALPASNMLRDDPQLIAQILAQAPAQEE